MKNVVKSDEDFLYLCSLIYDIRDSGFDNNKLACILERLLPRDANGNLLIKYRISEKGINTEIN